MRNFVLGFLTALSFFMTSAYGGTTCSFDLRILLANAGNKKYISSLNEIQLKREIEKVEESIEFFRLKKENSEPAIRLHFKKVIAELDAHLMTENFSAATRLVRTLFRRMEYAYFMIKDSKPYLDDMAKLSAETLDLTLDDFLAKLNYSQLEKDFFLSVTKNPVNGLDLYEKLLKEYNTQRMIIARNFHGYFLIRHHLEEVASLDDFKTKHLLITLGSQSRKEQTRFPNLFVGQPRPTLDEFQKLLYSDNELDLIRLKIERNFEIWQTLKTIVLQPHVLNAIFNRALNIPGMHKSKLVRLFRSLYDSQARQLYFPKINKVIRTKDISDKERVGLLRELNASTVADDLLVTFARRVDTRATDTWAKIKETSKENYPDFVSKLESAEKKAKSRGAISPVFKKSYVSQLATVLIAGGGIGYFYFGSDEVVSVEVTPIEEETLDRAHSSNDDDDESKRVLPETNEAEDGFKQEPFLPAPTQSKDDASLFDQHNKQLDSFLELLEGFPLWENGN